jgi:hypothetical protein
LRAVIRDSSVLRTDGVGTISIYKGDHASNDDHQPSRPMRAGLFD